MNRNFKWRALIVAAALVAAIVYIIPSLSTSLPSWWKKILPTDQVNLGLDLKGGMHLILEVQADKAVESSLERTVEDIKYTFRKEGVPATSVSRTPDNKLELTLTNPDDLNRVNKLLDREFPYLITEKETEADGRLTVRLGMDDSEAKRIKDFAARQALETIRNRIDQFGVSEPDIRPQGENRIVIQLPGIEDPQRAVELIGQTAQLEFKLVDESRSPRKAIEEGPPPGAEVAYMVEVDPETGRTTETPFVLRKRAQLTGEYITDARVNLDNQFNQPYVSLNFDSKGARIFERLTEANVGKRLAIVLDGKVQSAPVIQDKIPGGRAQITGRFTMEEARDLAIVLRAGALPAPVDILEERTVGPSLGHDSIRQGWNSIIVGMVLVLIFMVVYYRVAGLIADTALLMNVLLIMAALAAFRATLTLPGIAGIILTIGMSVDANVLIFERIREELRLGKTPRAAVSGGYDKATWTILDANVTTLIAAMVLFQFGTGPVRGFAVTLSIGILASLFTAMFVSRLVFEYLLVRSKVRVKMMAIIKEGVNINFVGNRTKAYFLSGALILLTIVTLAARGGPNYGVDFAGGILIQAKFDDQTNAQAVRDGLAEVGMEEASIQSFGAADNHEFLIRVQEKGQELEGLAAKVETSLENRFGSETVEIRRVEMVGPKVGKDLRQKALFAIFYAILFILIYISGRFELQWAKSIVVAGALMGAVYLASLAGIGVTGLIVVALVVTLAVCFAFKLKYALGANVALIHDVAITVGIFSLLNKEMTLTIVAALLTIVGYSLNDTIIVFDRIRENMRKHRKTPYEKVINTSINETLSRTILTSGTTLAVVLSLLFLGGPVIADFAFALMIGVLIGTYSSIFVASPILMIWPPQGAVRKKK